MAAENNVTGVFAGFSLENQSLDLFEAFFSFASCKEFFQGLLAESQRVDPTMTMTLLTFEGLYQIENSVDRRQFPVFGDEINAKRRCLQQWVSELERYYNNTILMVPKNPEILGSLVIFKSRQVPLPVFQKVPEDEGPCQVDLFSAFQSPDSCRNFFQWFLNRSQNAHPTMTLLALEGLYRIESDVQRGQFAFSCHDEAVKRILRNWRSEFQVDYKGILIQVPRILESLTIFKILQVPLFIDDYGRKVPLSTFGQQTELVSINENTLICHVTHSQEARSIIDQRQIIPSSKNSVAGCWFGIVEETQKSVYGSKSFQTTLSKLGVTGLNQGEIVKYKNEVNVILYAGDGGTGFQDLRKPTDVAVRQMLRTEEAYVTVSIFVPSSFLPDSQEFDEVFQGPFDVDHTTFCVREKRSYDKDKKSYTYWCKDRYRYSQS